MDEVFLLFGKETKGLPEDILKKYIDKTIRIPMRETLRSLNLSNSVAIIAYEVLRQKGFERLEGISSYFD
jgi:tRNA (cytidine/uridine-2'-O-)-methyltransferase